MVWLELFGVIVLGVLAADRILAAVRWWEREVIAPRRWLREAGARNRAASQIAEQHHRKRQDAQAKRDKLN